MTELGFPITADPLWLIAVFFGSLIVFDVLLVRALKLGKIAWKRVDYIWLGLGLLGLVGAATEVRRLVAANVLETRTTIRDDRYSDLRGRVQFMTGPAVCRTFVRGSLSPPNFEEVQREYDTSCEFGKGLLAALPPVAVPALNEEAFRRRPTISDPVLATIFSALDGSLGAYRVSAQQLAGTVQATDRTPGEVALAVSSPFLLAMALALRITKVTGEIVIEKRGA